MDELQELIKQKREIEERIRQIKTEAIVYGCTKVGFEHFPTQRPDEWFVSVKVPGVMPNDKTRYRSIIRGHSKKECIEKIPQIINDLQGLYESMKEGIDK